MYSQIQENERRAHFLFLNTFSVNKNIKVGNALRYLLKIDSLIHARNIGTKMRDERTIKLLCVSHSMSIYIKNIFHAEGDKCFCQVDHEGNTLNCFVYGSEENLSDELRKEIQSEVGFEGVIEAKTIPDFNDSESGIKQSDRELSYKVQGRVHSIIKEENDIYDIYIQNGPEFICITSDEWEIKPNIGDGVLVIVTGLCFYPTNT